MKIIDVDILRSSDPVDYFNMGGGDVAGKWPWIRIGHEFMGPTGGH